MSITRRDFLGGTALTLGAASLPFALTACQATGVEAGPDTGFALPGGYYPPRETGLRGSHDGSWETMHARVSGEEWPHGEVEEQYDLIIVGAGISGLAAAHLYRRERPEARILILDNHDDFGGHAKRNEFDVGGQFRMGYGGTEAIDTPSAYAPEARALLEQIGVRTEAFYDYFDQTFWEREGMSKSILFDEETYGETKLVGGYGQRSWEAFAADMPVSDAAKAAFVRVHTSEEDYMPGLPVEEKIERLSRMGYKEFLRDHAKVGDEVLSIYDRWGTSFWGVGIDEVPVTLIQDYDGGMPGVAHTLPRTGHRNDEPYIFHFPDGNASVARLLVRSLVPDAMPGSTQEDVVLAKADYSQLDRPDNGVRIRLRSTAVRMNNDRDGVVVTYVRDGTAHTARGDYAVMAGYNAALPYLCDEVPDEQAEALLANPKLPIVYTKVAVPDWQRFKQLGTDFIYYPNGFYKQVEFAYPVSIGGYSAVNSPDEPLVLHMCHTPWVPDVEGPDQWRVGRGLVLSTPFDTYEHHVKHQLTQALGPLGFDAERDISAITVNRWPHGYAFNPKLLWNRSYATEMDKPWVRGRQPVGRIHVANSDAGAAADTGVAIAQAHRAVMEILG